MLAAAALLSLASLTLTAAARPPDNTRTYLTLDHRNIIDR